MFQVPLATSSCNLSPKIFWDIVTLYASRPHLVNRKLLSASQMLFYKLTFKSKSVNHVTELLTRSAILYETRKLPSLSKETITENYIRNILECYDTDMKLSPSDEKSFKEDDGIFISVRILFPRNKNAKQCVEIVVFDTIKIFAYFLTVEELEKASCSPPFPYELQLTVSSNLRVTVANFEDADTTYAEWLTDKLFTKLLKWVENYDDDKSKNIGTLALIQIDEYFRLYHNLKKKYSEDLIKQWPSNTSTNPEKYIFEDLAIASYLICLWKQLALQDVSFVDCGCGNGLLVYILNQEGFNGYGIDIRRRAIWDIYPEQTKLEVGTVTPESVFPNSTWLIGNHSDELTPWLPVISLKSSINTNFFVLPCCPYDFNGQKYSRRNVSISQYADYINYIKEISETCDFRTDIDKLRIPSTKRTCLIGIRNDKNVQKISQLITDIETFIKSRCPNNFKARPSIEKVRNCTQLNRELITKIVSICVKVLLSEEHFIEASDKLWNAGSSFSLLDLSKHVPPEDLKELKNNCGGLQTLLRNHRYLFEVIAGNVKLRLPLRLNEDTKKYRNKPCWFLKNHPNGCLFSAEECAYLH